jgi:hypothetical protein
MGLAIVFLLPRGRPPSNRMQSLAFSPDGIRSPTGSRDESITVRDTKTAAEANPKAESNAEPPKAESSSATGEVSLAKLKGSWFRTDGTYVIEVRNVASDGKIDVAYYNPGPIHVSEAKATKDGDAIKLFVELRDVGYPGCTYRLDYNPQNDSLEGVYHQAAVGQDYPVVFMRLR